MKLLNKVMKMLPEKVMTGRKTKKRYMKYIKIFLNTIAYKASMVLIKHSMEVLIMNVHIHTIEKQHWHPLRLNIVEYFQRFLYLDFKD